MGRGTDLEKQSLHDIRGKRTGRDINGLTNHKDRRRHLLALAAEAVVAPIWMSKTQREIFEDLRNSIVMLDIATFSDKYTLQLLCTQYVQYLDVCGVIQDEGFMVEFEDIKGITHKKPHPLLVEKNRLYISLVALMKEYGMTPNTRRNVLKRDPDKPDTSEEEDWDELLN